MDFGSVFHVILTALVMLFMICLLVAAHEYGHYLFARLFGMGVEEFAIGFGKKPIWTWMRKRYSVEAVPSPAGTSPGVESSLRFPMDGSAALQPEQAPEASPTPANVKLVTTETTDFTVRPLPLGGFVRIKGMLPEEDGSETKIPGGFYSKAPWKRFIVLLAGPVFSVAAGVLIIFAQMVALGKTVPNGTTLDEVVPGGPAVQAGLKPGDKVLEIEGQKIESAYDVAVAIRDKAGQKLKILVQRGESRQSLILIPKLEETPSQVLDRDGNPTGEVRKQAKMLARWQVVTVPVSVGEAFVEAVKIPYTVVTTLGRLVTQPKQLKENVGGPISIAQATSNAVKFGPAAVIALAAMLSISVGIFNLLPIPPLDGGQMMVALAEMFRGGRRLSMKVQSAVAAVGFALVAVLFITVLTIDVGRLTGNKPKPQVESPKSKKTEDK